MYAGYNYPLKREFIIVILVLKLETINQAKSALEEVIKIVNKFFLQFL